MDEESVKLGPFAYMKLGIGLYRPAPVAPLSPNVQADLLRHLHAEYPALQQVPGGVLFSDPATGRVLVIDQTKIEAVEHNPNSPPDAVERIRLTFRKVVPVVAYAAPFFVRVDGAGTIQALEGLNPTQVLLEHARPREEWQAVAGTCAFAGLRFIFRTFDGGQRDLHVEPLFAQPDKFYLMVASSAGSGAATLDAALDRAREEAALIERLSDRIVSDLAAGDP
jgi:hypothetical protein